jgi:hypothetical protein
VKTALKTVAEVQGSGPHANTKGAIKFKVE